jgi:hypothetical protein
MDVVAQTGGTFAADVGFNGVGSREPPCTYGFTFTATMRPDGTITDFRMDSGFGMGSCTPVSALTVSGTVTSTDMKIGDGPYQRFLHLELTITDRAMCHDIFGLMRDFERVRETDRTLTISLLRLLPPASAMSST